MSEPKSMRKVREILRLRLVCHQELRAIAQSVGGSASTVHGHIERAKRANVHDWAAVSALSDEALSAAMWPGGRRSNAHKVDARAPFESNYLHMELRRPGVTLMTLWQEYQDRCIAHADGSRPYGYSSFCEQYAAYKKTLRRSMRQIHVAGERAFIDYSGKRPSIVDPVTGETRFVELFVMTLGASQYTFAEATYTQQIPDFCSSIMRGLEFFGGVPQVLVPDQLRSAVRGPDRYDPDINRTLLDLATHYGTTVLPARPRKPKDKAKVECAVLIVQRWVLARIRNETFTNLADLNVRIRGLITLLNQARFQKMDGTRHSLYESLEKPVLQALPAERFDIGLWKNARVHPDYHVSLLERFYSVPSQYVGAVVEIRYGESLVEIYLQSTRIASHARSYGARGSVTTERAHMPRAHQEMGAWTAERMVNWASTFGATIGASISDLLASYPRPEFGFRAALGVLRLAESHGAVALQDAFTQAKRISTTPPRRRLLLALMTRPQAATAAKSARTLGDHEHVRGSSYFDTDIQSAPSPILKDTLH